MAGEVGLTRLLLGMGLRQFSMHPAQLLAVKQQVLRSSIPEVEVIVQRILRSEDPERTRAAILRGERPTGLADGVWREITKRGLYGFSGAR